MRTFCPERLPAGNDPAPGDEKDQHVGQPVMVKLHFISIMPVTLPKPRGLHALEALNRNGKAHCTSS